MSQREKCMLVRIKIENIDGWYIATSPDLPGFTIAHQDRSIIENDVPDAIQLLLTERHGLECSVVKSEYGNPRTRAKNPPWLVIPPALVSSANHAFA